VSEVHPGITERAFERGEVSLNYAEGPGNGPPLVLLHGLGRRWQVFLPLIPALSLRWRIFAPDFRGHGRSGRVPRGYRGQQYAEDVARFLRDRVQEPAVVFGHSLGGMVGMWVACHHPELVRALILGDNMIVPRVPTKSSGDQAAPNRGLRNPMYTALFLGLRDLAHKGGSIEGIADGIGKILLPLPGSDDTITIRQLPGNDEAYLLSWARCVQQTDPDAYDMTLDGSALEGWDGETVLRGISCPTLLLQGSPELGGLMSDSDVALATRLLPHHTHVRFRNLGHALFIQQPEPVLRAVTNFLESL
jgi:pimeloyl-ACP methyl ester carboxylesterase